MGKKFFFTSIAILIHVFCIFDYSIGFLSAPKVALKLSVHLPILTHNEVNKDVYYVENERSFHYFYQGKYFMKKDSHVLMKERLRWDPFTGEYVFAEDPKTDKVDTSTEEDDHILETLITQQSEANSKIQRKTETRKKKMKNSVKYISPEDIVLSEDLFQETKKEQMHQNVLMNGSPITPDTPAMSIGAEARREDAVTKKENEREKTKEEKEAEEEQQFLDFLQSLHGSTGQRGTGSDTWPNLTSSMLSMIRYERDMIIEKTKVSKPLPLFPQNDQSKVEYDLNIGIWTNEPNSAFEKSIIQMLDYISKKVNSKINYHDISRIVNDNVDNNEDSTSILKVLNVLLIVPDPYKNGPNDSNIMNPFASIVSGFTAAKDEKKNCAFVDNKSVEKLISTIFNLQFISSNDQKQNTKDLRDEIEEREDMGKEGNKLRHVLLLSPLGTDRINEFPFNLQNLQGALDRKRGIEQSIRYLSSIYGYNYNILKIGELPKDSTHEMIDLNEVDYENKCLKLRKSIANIEVGQGDRFQGTTSLSSINMAIFQSLINPTTYNTTFSIIEKPPGKGDLKIPLENTASNVEIGKNLFTDPAINGKWNDEFSRLDGPELRRFTYSTSKAKLEIVRQVIRAWARQYMDGTKRLVTPIFAIRTKTGVKLYFNPKKNNSIAPRFKDIKEAEKIRRKGDPLKETMNKNKQLLGESSDKKKVCYLEGGLEIIVDERATYSLNSNSQDSEILVRVKRCAMEPSTTLKAMSEKELLNDLEDELSQMI